MKGFTSHPKRKLCVLPVLYFLPILISALISVSSAVPNPINGPRFSPLLTPPQVLLPPHREEGQSLDDIIYGTSFSGSALQNFPFLKSSPVEVPRPNEFSSTSRPATSPPPPPAPPSIPVRNPNSIHNAPVLPSMSQQIPPRAFSHRPNNVNLVQTFTPPSPPPPPSSNSVFRPSPLSSSTAFSPPTSAEEIKVPQTVKHRTPQRKQYTKADLIAAANSIKPAGFDFSKVLIVTPSNNNLNGSDKDVSSLYNKVMFPLPLFDTPVYNQLRPLMEMLMKARYNLGGGSVSDSKKVLVIIPKAGNASATNTNVLFSNPLLNNNKPPVKHTLQSSATTTTSSKSSPSAKFVASPKISSPKHFATTAKPKPFVPGFTTTTKRTSKVAPFPSTPSAVKITGKKLDKGPDLQAAATVNKLSQRPGGNSPTSADKRTYSSKGADNYSFSYAVKNDAYKDIKSHSESRDGDQVEGEYSMLEADGYTRVVRYTVDSDHGFKASVKRIPPS